MVNGGAGWPTRVQDGLAAATRARLIAAHAGQVLTLGGIRLRLLWPPPPGPGFRPEGDPNLRAVVAHVQVGAFDLLLPADAESEVTAALELPEVEALKVAHHGSADEGLPALLERTGPTLRRDRGRPRQHATATRRRPRCRRCAPSTTSTAPTATARSACACEDGAVRVDN